MLGSPDKPGVFVDSTSGVNSFSTLIELRDKLLNNDTVGLSGSGGILEDIDTAARNLAAGQTRLGGSQEILTLDRNRLIENISTLDQHLADVEDADTVALILELNNVQNVYEAALSAGGRLFTNWALELHLKQT